MPFDEQKIKDAGLVGEIGSKLQRGYGNMYFKEFRKNFYRKGLLVKYFNIKAIDVSNILPRPEERQLFLEAFDNNNENEDSDEQAYPIAE